MTYLLDRIDEYARTGLRSPDSASANSNAVDTGLGEYNLTSVRLLLGFVLSDSDLKRVAVATAFTGPSPAGSSLQFNHPARTYRLRETGRPYFHRHRHSLHRSTCRQRFLDMVLARPISLRTQTSTSTGLHPQILRRSHQRQREPFPTQVPTSEPYIPRRTQHAVWQRQNK